LYKVFHNKIFFTFIFFVLQQLNATTPTSTLLEVFMHEMAERIDAGVEAVIDRAKENQVFDHVTKRMERLHTSMTGNGTMTSSDMTDVVMMTLALPMLSTVVHLLSGQPLSFVAGFLAMAAPLYMINHMEHEHEHEIHN
jgi:ABC-type dipeptide/oligopeptide/nickel transport system permease component